MPTAVRQPVMESAFNDLKLDDSGEDESFEVQVPDFHFDWGVVTEDKAAAEDEKKGSAISRSSAGTSRTTERWRPQNDNMNTPPSVSGRSGSPAYSSASSAHIMGLTDASTASGSSLVPTPPYAPLGRGYMPRISGASDGDGSAQPERVVRRFQRVVSAPVARMSPAPLLGDRTTREMDESIASTSTYRQQHTATIRPPLAHSTSSGAVNGDQPASHYTTPGLTDRTLGHSTAASTSRRVGGLSRFGGPARRVIAPLEELEGAEDQAAPLLISSPQLMPPRSSPPPQHSRLTRERSAEPLYDLPEPSPPHRPSPTAIPSRRDPSPPPSSQYRHSPPPPERPSSRAFDRYGEQENRPVRAAPQHSYAASTSAIQRIPQPLQPAHMYSRSSDHMLDDAAAVKAHRSPPQPRNPEMVSSRVAPRPVEPPPSSSANTMPAAPVAVAPQGKRSFMVNGTPYERIGTLGKGGSSKVYSVLCHTTRAMYALKRVALDRADAEAYQSYTNEIELLKRLRGHDRIIRLIDHQISFGPGNRPKILMMVMECGEIDFAALLDDQRGKPLNMNFVGLYWQQMLEAVHAVHQENVVHTDLKPANFVLVQGRLKIIDFGIAKAVANDTVNIQRDQQIGTVNYMSPEAIQRMNNQKVLKLSYPSDVWSLGCILYQMIYGSPPFQHIGGGPLPKMNAIANSAYVIDYPTHAVPKPTPGRDEPAATWSIRVLPSAIDVMQGCLKYKKEFRMTIPELLVHEFLIPTIGAPTLPNGATSITRQQMAMLVKFIVEEHGKKPLPEGDTTASDLFEQLSQQNSRAE